MSRSTRTVTFTKKTKTDRLPSWAHEGAGLVQWLQATGTLNDLASRLQIQRQGGYVGLDLVLFLLFLLTARLDGGIKGFAAQGQPHRSQLAALAARRSLPTPASVSRILGVVADSHTHDLAPWLLLQACHAKPLLEHPSVRTRDTHADGWHVFDLDPRITVLRQRALPQGQDLPAAQRRSHQLLPGYPGRKRGEVQFSRLTLQHAGSSLWMGLWMAPGNGQWREHSHAAIQQVASVCDELAHPKERALVRVDGVGGNVPFITACQEAGIHYLTRGSNYGLLEQPELRAHLDASDWVWVTDSRSGPRRQATELGLIWLSASPETVQEDGQPYPPVRVRVVVSRFRAQPPEEKRGAGVLIDGWQYELYLTSLSADGWPADDIVTTYYGRTGQENRFGQEDQQLQLDQLYSYHLPGQQLAHLIGLWLWNVRLCRGFALSTVPQDVPRQPAYAAHPVESGSPRLVAPPTENDEVAPLAPSTAAPARQEELAAVHDEDVPEQAPDGVPSEVQRPAAPGASPPTRREAHAALHAQLAALDWPSLLQDKPGWRWDAQEGLLCPNHEKHPMRSVKVQGLDRTRQLRFSAPFRACGGCPCRTNCTQSSDPLYRKETAITVPSAVGYQVQQLQQASRGRSEPPPPAPVEPKAQKSPVPRSPKPLPAAPGPRWQPIGPSPGPYAVTPACLLPVVLRKRFVGDCRALEVHVRVQVGLEPVVVEMFARTAAQRQNRRRTWAEREAWNALPDNSRVDIEFAGGEPLRKVLRPAIERRSTQTAA
jgi:hypothetical protein